MLQTDFQCESNAGIHFLHLDPSAAVVRSELELHDESFFVDPVVGIHGLLHHWVRHHLLRRQSDNPDSVLLEATPLPNGQLFFLHLYPGCLCPQSHWLSIHRQGSNSPHRGLLAIVR